MCISTIKRSKVMFEVICAVFFPHNDFLKIQHRQTMQNSEKVKEKHSWQKIFAIEMSERTHI